METLIRKIDKNQIDEESHSGSGKASCGKGRLVAFPTETVYGLGADALKEEAAKENLCGERQAFR